MNRMGKKTRFRNVEGERSTWKRALVSLHEEDRIEFF
jgi:ribosomal protein L23